MKNKIQDAIQKAIKNHGEGFWVEGTLICIQQNEDESFNILFLGGEFSTKTQKDAVMLAEIFAKN